MLLPHLTPTPPTVIIRYSNSLLNSELLSPKHPEYSRDVLFSNVRYRAKITIHGLCPNSIFKDVVKTLGVRCISSLWSCIVEMGLLYNERCVH